MGSPVPATNPAPRLDVLGGLTRALLAVAVLLAGVWLYARVKNPFPYYGTPYSNRPAAAAFTGTDQQGETFSFDQTRGQTVALFFGFTHCADVCPLTLKYLEQARGQLPTQERGRLRIVFVSLDPARDTTARLADYARLFGSGVTMLRVAEPQLARAAGAYGVSYAKVSLTAGKPVDEHGDYSINHTTATYLIGPEGYLRLAYDPSQLTNVNRVAGDIEHVMKE